MFSGERGIVFKLFYKTFYSFRFARDTGTFRFISISVHATLAVTCVTAITGYPFS